MNKQPELTALTKKTLIDTYFTISAKGERATVGAITDQAGYNRSTFYRYFTDTEQLLSQVENEICTAFQSALGSHSSVFSPLELVNSLADVYQQYGSYLSVLLGRHGDLGFVNKVKTIMQPMAWQLLATTSEPDITTELKIEFVLNAVLATVTKWYEMEQPISAVQLGMLMKNLLQNGIFEHSVK